MKRVIVVGGGIAGTIVANRMARMMPEEIEKGEAEIVVLDKNEKHTYQPGQLLVPFNVQDPMELTKPERELLDHRIKFLHGQKGDVTKIDPANHSVVTADGVSHSYDYLVIATGSHLRWDEVPGYKDVVYSPWDFLSALKLREELDQFSGGTVVINVAKLPHKCSCTIGSHSHARRLS